MTAAYEKTGALDATTITAFSVAWEAAPATSKILLTCAPECPATLTGTGLPTWSPPSKIVNVSEAAESPRLYTPTLVRKPSPDPRFRIDVRTVVVNASPSESPGMNMPTVGSGSVEKSRLVTTSCSSDPEKSNS